MNSNITKPIYQSTFLPLVQKAETEIKKMVYFYAMHNKPKKELMLKLKGIISAVDEKMPKDVINRQDYIDGLKMFANAQIKNTYEPIIRNYYAMLVLILMLGLKKQNSPLEMIKYTNNTLVHKSLNQGLQVVQNNLFKDFKDLETKKAIENLNQYTNAKKLSDLDLWGKAKGTPQVPYYDREVNKRINQMVQNNVTSPNGISLWQKAEIDIRYEHQMQHLNDIKDSGVRYAYGSTHPDCSKRCQHWQGKLFDLTATKSELSGFRMKKKIDGHQVYCFNDVINQTQKMKNGKVYKNNFYVGFNCRHKLIPYKGQLPPESYDKDDIEKERKINAKLRAMERQLRKLKQQYVLRPTKQLKAKIQKLYNDYVAFAEKYGFPHLEWRIKV